MIFIDIPLPSWYLTVLTVSDALLEALEAPPDDYIDIDNNNNSPRLRDIMGGDDGTGGLVRREGKCCMRASLKFEESS